MVGGHGLADVDGRTGGKLLDASSAFDVDRCRVGGVGGDLSCFSVNPQVQPMTAVPDRKAKRARSFRPQRAKYQSVAASLKS